MAAVQRSEEESLDQEIVEDFISDKDLSAEERKRLEDEPARIFGDVEEFKLTPSEPTTEEKLAISKMKGEVKAPEKKGEKPKAVIPD